MRQKATYVGRFRSYDSRMCVVVLSKRALNDFSIYCTFYFFFYLLVKLFTLPELIALVNKDLQYDVGRPPKRPQTGLASSANRLQRLFAAKRCPTATSGQTGNGNMLETGKINS